MVRPDAAMTSGVAWCARPVLVLPATTGRVGENDHRGTESDGRHADATRAAMPTVGGGSATTGAAGF